MIIHFPFISQLEDLSFNGERRINGHFVQRWKFYVTCSKVESKINLDTSVLLWNKKWEGEKEKNVENKYDVYIYEFCEKKK